MEKAINITINGQVFYIEEKAYQKLSEYLDSVKKHFSPTEGGEEIVNDIEIRISEKFSSKTSSKKEVINLKDVESVIKSMGTVDDLNEFENIEPKETKSFAKKRLQRDPDNAMIAGVASGVAAYFNIDPVAVRIIFVILLFFPTGLSLLTYCIYLRL